MNFREWFEANLSETSRRYGFTYTDQVGTACWFQERAWNAALAEEYKTEYYPPRTEALRKKVREVITREVFCNSDQSKQIEDLINILKDEYDYGHGNGYKKGYDHWKLNFNIWRKKEREASAEIDKWLTTSGMIDKDEPAT